MDMTLDIERIIEDATDEATIDLPDIPEHLF